MRKRRINPINVWAWGIACLVIIVPLIGLIKYAFTGCEEKTNDLPRTVLQISNNSGADSVLTYLTLGSDTSFITDVNGVFGIKGSGTQGHFYLKKDSVYTYHYAGKGISGNITFGSPPLNCPTSQWLDGINIYEFTLNANRDIPKGQETFDISNVAGVNAEGAIITKDGGAWIAGGDTVTTVDNYGIYKNYGKYGVFPVGCDLCTESKNPPKCKPSLTPAKPQADHICNVSRSSKLAGGSVRISFMGWAR